jgi:hypothetical protein
VCRVSACIAGSAQLSLTCEEFRIRLRDLMP